MTVGVENLQGHFGPRNLFISLFSPGQRNGVLSCSLQKGTWTDVQRPPEGQGQGQGHL